MAIISIFAQGSRPGELDAPGCERAPQGGCGRCEWRSPLSVSAVRGDDPGKAPGGPDTPCLHVPQRRALRQQKAQRIAASICVGGGGGKGGDGARGREGGGGVEGDSPGQERLFVESNTLAGQQQSRSLTNASSHEKNKNIIYPRNPVGLRT